MNPRGILLVVFIASAAMAARPFDADKCPNGCKGQEQCPENSACVAVNADTNCGLCICSAGYKTFGTKCVPNKGVTKSNGKTTTTTEAVTTESTTEATTSSTQTSPEATTSPTTSATSPTTTGSTTQSPVPPTPEPLSCANYACSVNPGPVNDTDPLTVRSRLFTEPPGCKRRLSIPSRPCNIIGGGGCFGDYCLTISQGNDYCICPPYRTDRQCAVEKPGKCDSATGKAQGTPQQSLRFKHKINPDHGSIYGRHFATDIGDCIRECQWAGNSNCKSVNFGQLSGASVCEMLSVAATKGSLLEPWLVSSPGWQYVIV